jgi:hypothetical protein
MSDGIEKAGLGEAQTELGEGVEAGQVSAEGGVAETREVAVTGQGSGVQQSVVQQGLQEVSQAPAGVEEFVVALPAKQQMVLRGILETGNVAEVARRTGEDDDL